MTTQEIEALQAERDALAAQLDVLRTAALNAISFMSGGTAKAELRDAYDATPQQCLRDVQAEAIEAAISSCFLYADDVLALDELKRYAESVRQGGAE